MIKFLLAKTGKCFHLTSDDKSPFCDFRSVLSGKPKMQLLICKPKEKKACKKCSKLYFMYEKRGVI